MNSSVCYEDPFLHTRVSRSHIEFKTCAQAWCLCRAASCQPRHSLRHAENSQCFVLYVIFSVHASSIVQKPLEQMKTKLCDRRAAHHVSANIPYAAIIPAMVAAIFEDLVHSWIQPDLWTSLHRMLAVSSCSLQCDYCVSHNLREVTLRNCGQVSRYYWPVYRYMSRAMCTMVCFARGFQQKLVPLTKKSHHVCML